jgi:hypothetical protein
MLVKVTCSYSTDVEGWVCSEAGALPAPFAKCVRPLIDDDEKELKSRKLRGYLLLQTLSVEVYKKIIRLCNSVIVLVGERCIFAFLACGNWQDDLKKFLGHTFDRAVDIFT